MRNRWFYPDNWEQLAWECKERAGWCCEHCGLAHGAQMINVETGVVSTVVLSAAHLDHDPWTLPLAWRRCVGAAMLVMTGLGMSGSGG